MRFLDADIFINFLIKEDEGKSKASYMLFQKLAKEEEKGITTEIVLNKVINILASPPFSLSPEEIRGKLTPLILVSGLRIPHKRLIIRALDIFVETKEIDFTDALTVAYMVRDDIKEIYSFDKNLDKLPQIKRIEP